MSIITIYRVEVDIPLPVLFECVMAKSEVAKSFEVATIKATNNAVESWSCSVAETYYATFYEKHEAVKCEKDLTAIMEKFTLKVGE